MPDDPALTAAFADRDAHEADFRSAVAVRVGQLATDRDDALSKASTAVTEQNRLLDMVTQRDATIAAVQKRLADLEAGGSGIPVYKPGTAFVPAGNYILPLGVTDPIVVNAKGVTLWGGLLIPSARGDAISAPAGVGDDLTVIGTRFDWAAGPAGRGLLGVKHCVRTNARNTRLIGLEARRVDGFIIAYTQSDGTLVDACTSGDDVRAGVFYGAGCKNALLRLCRFTGSQTENLVRFNTETGVSPDNCVVTMCDLANDEGPVNEKAVLEFRYGSHLYAIRNILRSLDIPEHVNSCIGVGHSDQKDSATDVWLLRNELHFGHIDLHNGSGQVEAHDNEIYGLTVDKDVAFTVNGGPGNAHDIRARRNVAYVPTMPKKKTFFAPISPEKIVGLDVDASNKWVVKP